MNRIYLDYAASTPVDPKVFAAMAPYFTEKFGNPSSIHSYGQEAQSAVDNARQQVADFLHCRSQEIIFTGSATEANNLALRGVVEHALASGKKNAHIISTRIEHESILVLLEELVKDIRVSITLLPVSREGVVDINALKNALTEDTVVVSVMYANNEIGTIQPIEEIARIIKDFKEEQKGNSPFPYLHTDAVQAALYCPMDISLLGADILTLSGHKMYAPKGIGALYIKKGTALTPLVHGSGQEYGKRSGTENVPGIVGMGSAVSMIDMSAHEGVKKLRNRLVEGVLKNIPNTTFNGNAENSIPHIVNILFKDISSSDLIIRLDGEGIAVSAGAACQSKALSVSHVLEALGVSKKDASCSLRFSLGKYTTENDIDMTVAALLKLVRI